MYMRKSCFRGTSERVRRTGVFGEQIVRGARGENPPEYALRLLEVLDRRPPRTRFEDVTIRAVDHTYRA
jgi:hypothetical protein